MKETIQQVKSFITFDFPIDKNYISARFASTHLLHLKDFPQWSTKATQQKLIANYWFSDVFKHFATLVCVPALLISFFYGRLDPSLVGSSKISSLGQFKREIAIPSLCFIPIEYSLTFLLASVLRFTIFKHSSILFFGIFNSVAAKRMFSLAVKFGYAQGVSIIEPTCLKISVLKRNKFFLKIAISPDDGFKSPSSIFIVVVLPAPFAPKSHKYFPLQ